MQTGRLILLLLLVLVVAVVVVLLVRRSAARKEQQRVEAATLRADADQIAARLAGQAAFAQQSAERAEVARAEAEQRAREAARLEEEAAEQRSAAEAARRDYEQAMRRADDVDPDVAESSFPPVDDDAHRPSADAGAGAGAAGAGAAGAGAAAAGAALWGRSDGERHPESERIASAADYRDDTSDAVRQDEVSGGAPVGRAGGMSDDARPDNDDLGTEREGEAPTTSRDPDVSHDVESPRGEWGGPRQDAEVDRDAPVGVGHGMDEGADRVADDGADRGADESAPLSVIADPEAYAATEPVLADDQTPPVEPRPVSEGERQSSVAGATHDDADAGADHGADAGADHDADAGADHGADAGADHGADAGADHGADAGADHGADAGADHGADAGAERTAHHGADAGAEPGAATAGSGDLAIVADPDQYASTEPLLASEGGARSDDDDRRTPDGGVDADRALAADDRTSRAGDLADPDAHAPAETGAAVAENDASTWTAGDDAERTTGDRPSRDWAAEEGELLDETHDRGDRLAEERQDLATSSGTSTDAATGAAPGAAAGAAQRAARRISDFDELRDGGFGVGSAAPLDDGAQPLDHPVQGHRESKSFHMPGDPGYDTAEPDVWFYDEGAAERAGFRRAGR